MEITQITEFLVNGSRVVNIDSLNLSYMPAWAAGINSVVNPDGPVAGRGRFLIKREDFNANFPEQGPYSIKITRTSTTEDAQEIELMGYVTVESFAALSIPNSPMVVEVADIRHLLEHRFVGEDFDEMSRTEIAEKINELLEPHGSITVEDGNQLGQLRYHGVSAIMAAWDLATRSNKYIAFDQSTGQVKTADHTGDPHEPPEKMHKQFELAGKLEARQVKEVTALFETGSDELYESVVDLQNDGTIGQISWGTHTEEEGSDTEAEDMKAIWSAWAGSSESRAEFVGAHIVEHGPDVSQVSHSVYQHEVFTTIETGRHYPPFLRRQRIDCPRSSVKLQNCETGLVVYSENVDTGDDQKLLDLVGSVVSLRSTALLKAACWMVVEESDCPPEICPVVCAITDDCGSCCIRFTQCNDISITKLADLSQACESATSPIRNGDVVLLDDDECYTVALVPCGGETEEVTIVKKIEDCETCGECWELTGCWTTGQIDIFKDDHGLAIGDVVSIGGVCYEVTGEPPDCEFATHAEIDTEGFFPGCVQCGCFLLTPCETSGADPIVTSGSLGAGSSIAELKAGTIVRLDNGNCYSVSNTDSECETAEDFVTVVQDYDKDDCAKCVLYLLQDCEFPTDSQNIVTFSDLSDYFVDDGNGSPPEVIIKRAEDERCYKILGVAPEEDFDRAVEVTVESTFSSCNACLFPVYLLSPECESCEDSNPSVNSCEAVADAEQVAGSGFGLATDRDLSEFVGRMIKLGGVCYSVALADFDAEVTPNVPTEQSGPFEDCETCQKECVWLTVRTYEDGDTIKEDQIRVIVDKVCDKRTREVITIEDCETTGGP